MEPEFRFSFPIPAQDFRRAGDAASKIKRLMKQAGLPSGVTRRAAVIAYEAEMNLVIHSVGGELTLEITPERVVIQAVDTGPGIPNIDLAMQEGWSTASDEIRELGFGAGMGLPNMKRNADGFSIHSEVGTGTELTASIAMQQ